MDAAAPAAPVHLVGFSKGGVVLNQLLTELAELSMPTAHGPIARQARTAPPRFNAAPPVASLFPPPATVVPEAAAAPTPEAAALLRAISSVHYVDAGLNSRGAYLTDSQVWLQNVVGCLATPGRKRHIVMLVKDEGSAS